MLRGWRYHKPRNDFVLGFFHENPNNSLGLIIGSMLFQACLAGWQVGKKQCCLISRCPKVSGLRSLREIHYRN